MGTTVLLVVVILLPTAIGLAAVGSVRLARWWVERRRSASASVPPIEELGADLRRLHAQLDQVETQPPRPGKGLRVRALRAAYLDALCSACQRLDVASPRPATGNCVSQAEIYRVEAELRGRGLDVRTRGAP